MGIYLLKSTGATAFSAKNLIVAAESEANAKIFASSHFSNDSDWSEATSTTLAETTLDAPTSMLGYIWSITIVGGTITDGTQTVTTTGTGTDDLDDIADLLVIELNGLADIAGAAYVAPNLTVASGGGGDDLGDAKVYVTVNPPSGHTISDLSSLFVASITDEGAAADALTVALVADTVTAPEVLEEI